MPSLPPLIFMHIPKTAGQSMFAALSDVFGTGVAEMYHHSVARPAPAIETLRDERYSLYCGHFCFGLHPWLGRPASYFSVVRHPVKRAISLYGFLRGPRRWFGELRKRSGKDIAELIRLGQIGDFYEDYLAWLHGEDSIEVFLDSPSPELENGMVRRFSGVGLAPGPCPAGALARAQETIERCFTVVGVVEQFDRSLELLGRAYDLPRLRPTRVNVTPRAAKPEPDGAIVARVAASNQLDLALYDWVVERFERQHAAATPPTPVVLEVEEQRNEVPPLWKGVGRLAFGEVATKLGGIGTEDERFGGPLVMPTIA